MCDKYNNIFINFLQQLDHTTKDRKKSGQPGPFWCHFSTGDGRHVRFRVSDFSMKVMREKAEIKKEASRLITVDQFAKDMRNGISS